MVMAVSDADRRFGFGETHREEGPAAIGAHRHAFDLAGEAASRRGIPAGADLAGQDLLIVAVEFTFEVRHVHIPFPTHSISAADMNGA
jgi:hypothetical protein